MKLISRFILSTLTDTIALLLAAHYLSGLIISPNIISTLSLGAILAAINIFIRPVVYFVFWPLFILTFGLLSVVINTGLLYLLDFLSYNIKINSLRDALITGLVISLVSILINNSAKSIYKK